MNYRFSSHRLGETRHERSWRVVFGLLFIITLALPAPFLRAQTDAKGNPMSAEDLVNNHDSSTTPKGRSTQVDRNPDSQNIDHVWVYDPKGRKRREIRIDRDPLGNAHVESIDFRPDEKTASTETTTSFAPGFDGQRHPTDRKTIVYPTAGGFVTPDEKLKHSTGWQEKWEDGHWVRVAELKDGQWVSTQKQPPPQEKTISSLLSNKSVNLAIAGTGNTIGDIAHLKVQNLTDQPISCVIPPMILESTSGKNQHYACPKGQTVAIKPHDTATVPIDGVCINRHKPPVGKDVTGDLVINTGDPTAPQNPDSHLPAKDANNLLRIARSKYDAADKLQKDGELKDLPYHDKQKQKDVVVQWSTWTDPDISEIVGGPPATKDDLKKVVYKQVEESGPMTPGTKKKVDKGIDTIFEKVELTSKKAKDLEEPDQYAETGTPPNTVEIADHSGDTTTQEKPKGKGRGKGKGKGKGGKKWPKPIQDWLDKKKAADDADNAKKWAQDQWDRDLENYCLRNSEHYRELRPKQDEKSIKAFRKNGTQTDKDDFEKGERELKTLRQQFARDFQKTDQAKEDSQIIRDSEKAADAAHEAEQKAGKNIDPATKSVVEAEEPKSEIVPGVW